jgi:hypothetical protein
MAFLEMTFLDHDESLENTQGKKKRKRRGKKPNPYNTSRTFNIHMLIYSLTPCILVSVIPKRYGGVIEGE